MPVGVPLSELRRELRAETGQSLNPAQGVQSQGTQDIVINRQQRELWEEFAWPHLRYYIDVPLLMNQSIYNYPPSVTFEQITNIYIATAGSRWNRLSYGIRAFDVPLGGASPGNPVRWANRPLVDPSTGKTNALGQLELSPKPAADGTTMRLEAQAPITDMVADTDTCIIDSKLIVLFAASEILATQKSEGAAFKLKKAQQYLTKLQAAQGPDKRASYNMGGSQGRDYRGRIGVPGIDYIP